MTDGWLFEEADPLSAGWMLDAPWVKANGEFSHEFMVRGSRGVFRQRLHLSLVGPEDLLQAVLYGDPLTDRRAPTGLSAFFNTRDPAQAQNAVNVLDGGATEGPASSAWLLGWGPRTLHMVSHDGLPLSFSGHTAIVPMDWRFVVRIANIGLKGPRLEDLLDKALLRLPDWRSAPIANIRPIFYVNSTVRGRLRDEGIRDDHLRMVPIRVVDELRDDEPIV